jgi:carnosine N-methyltransferase
MEFDNADEERHFRDIVLSFYEYFKDCEREIRRRELAMAPLDVERLPLLASRPKAMRECTRVNQLVLNQVYLPYREHLVAHLKDLDVQADAVSSPAHRMTKVRVTLHQIAREWSAEGEAERASAFGSMLRVLEQRLPKGSLVAVPGCGLGRLVVETAARGYVAQGSEFSYEMLLTGDWIMNRLQAKAVIHPWFDQASNVPSFEETARPVEFPDRFAGECLAADASGLGGMSIVAGEFAHIYGATQAPEAAKFDAILACFFLDTAPNLGDYLKVMHHMLKRGGFLVSFGPLMWHWQPPYGADPSSVEDERYAQSLELTLEDVLLLVQSFGFRLVESTRHPNVRYNDNVLSMQHNTFDCALLVFQKL